jgi:cell division protein FtsB
MQDTPSQVRGKADATYGSAAQDAAEPLLKVPHPRRSTPWVRRALVFLACVILLDSLFGDRGLAETMRARREHRRAAAELARLKDQNAALRDETHRLAADPATIEAVARQELGLVRPGEILVVVTDLK